MTTRAEVDLERSDALGDLQEEGAPVLLRYVASTIPEGGVERTPVAPVDVQTYALVKAVGSREIDGDLVLLGDKSVLIEHASLGALAQVVAEIPTGQQPGFTGLSVFFEERDPVAGEKTFPVPGGAGVREYRVIGRLPSPPPLGGWHIVHRLQVRG